MEITIAGAKYPVEYTVLAEEYIDKKYGGVEKMGSAIDELPGHQKVVEFSALLAMMIDCGISRQRKVAELLHNDYNGPEPLDVDAIQVLMHPGEIVGTVYAAMKEGNASTIKLEAPKGKNAGAATP